jgi:hypothetical protein
MVFDISVSRYEEFIDDSLDVVAECKLELKLLPSCVFKKALKELV